MELKRVYYSGFEPVPQTPLEKRNSCPLSREHCLYQISSIIRDYKFKANDFAPIVNDKGFLPNTDPKLALEKQTQTCSP